MTDEWIKENYPTPDELRKMINLCEEVDRKKGLTDKQRQFYNELCAYRVRVYPKNTCLSAWYDTFEIFQLFD